MAVDMMDIDIDMGDMDTDDMGLDVGGESGLVDTMVSSHRQTNN